MTTEGGGWTLIARITNDYGWMCADRNGENCVSSAASPGQANLWHPSHARSSIAPEFVSGGLDSGVHLPKQVAHRLFREGRNSLRFSFYRQHNLTLAPDNDAVAQFFLPQDIFTDESLVLDKDRHYELRVLRHDKPYTTSIPGERICWLPRDDSKRGFEGGLFMGRDTIDPNRPCHLNNDASLVQLKAHMAFNGGTEWYSGQFGYLKHSTLQVKHEAIQIWVR